MTDENFMTKMLHEAMERDPRMAIQMLMAAIKLPVMHQFLEEHKEEMNNTVSIDLKAGEVAFMYGACLFAIGSMGHNPEMQSAGQLHVHALKEYIGAGMKVAAMTRDMGYPEPSAISDMAGAIASVGDAFVKIGNIREKVESGDVQMDEIDDLIGREFR